MISIYRAEKLICDWSTVCVSPISTRRVYKHTSVFSNLINAGFLGYFKKFWNIASPFAPRFLSCNQVVQHLLYKIKGSQFKMKIWKKMKRWPDYSIVTLSLSLCTVVRNIPSLQLFPCFTARIVIFINYEALLYIDSIICIWFTSDT